LDLGRAVRPVARGRDFAEVFGAGEVQESRLCEIRMIGQVEKLGPAFRPRLL